MALNTLDTSNPASQRGVQESMRNAIFESRRLTVTVATGAGANTNIPVTGIVTTDTLLSVIEVPAATTTLVDRTSTSSITSPGNIQCTATTAGNQVLVLWYDKS